MLDKHFLPENLGKKWSERWENLRLFQANPELKGSPYSMVIPPPNVTGKLHMGHAFQYTLMDTLCRFQRGMGRNVLWQMGTDHAGIATQMMVEKHLQKTQGKTRQDLGREAFLKEVWRWKEEHQGGIESQIKALGASLDFSDVVFTLDEGMSEAVYVAFEKLFEQGLIYRKTRLINWDPTLQTALSDLEITHKESQSKLYKLCYPSKDGSFEIHIETTRPETIFGDMAIAVHPEDERYSSLVGKLVLVPLEKREIPIISDASVDQNFGTGAVKITPSHDFNDYEVGLKHNLAHRIIMDGHANMCAPAPLSFCSLSREEARKKVIEELTSSKDLISSKPHQNTIPISERSGALIEPRLMPQWYIATKTLGEKAIKAAEKAQNGGVWIEPKSFHNSFISWMNELQDWCISRQLWWGHRIPVYYDSKGKAYVGRNEAHARTRANLPKDTPLKQDEDVLDTWFSSSLWSFASLGFPKDTQKLKTYHPTSVLITGFDILFFWVARMMMLSLHLRDEVPFHRVHLTGLIRDELGQKMSKTKGNVIDPMDVISGITLDELLEKRLEVATDIKQKESIKQHTKKSFQEGIKAYGVDALRFSLLLASGSGQDIRFELSRLDASRHFLNKLYNGARFSLISAENLVPTKDFKPKNPIHRFIFKKIKDTKSELEKDFEAHRFEKAALSIQKLIWHNYCDWYIELCKSLILDEGDQREAQQSLLVSLSYILSLAHPLIPFITEELFEAVCEKLDIKSAPLAGQLFENIDDDWLTTEKETQDIEELILLVSAIRSLRGENGVSPAKKLSCKIIGAKPQEINAIKRLAHLSSVELLEKEPEGLFAKSMVFEGCFLLIPLEELLDLSHEVARLEKKQNELNALIAKLEDTLQNKSFIQKAPKDLVEKRKHELLSHQENLQITKEELLRLQKHDKENS